MGKLIDCVTFFDNNYIFDFRYHVIKNHVDKFVVCESLFDHKNNPKKLNFDLENKYKNNSQVIHLVLKDPFPKKTNSWQNQAIQREYILENLGFANDEDYIMFSDPDEIPNPDVLKGIDLKNKFGVFNQLFFNYKFNLFNPHETPWDGTRICKKKNLKSIDDLRNKIKTKNLGYSFLRFDKEKNIQVFANAGWHFNNIMSPENISLKLKTFAHKEYSSDKFSSVENIKEKINKRIDLFGRDYSYEAIEIDNRFPKYLRENLNKFKKFIID